MLSKKKLVAAVADLEAAVRHYNSLPERVIAHASALHGLRSPRGPEVFESVSRWSSSLANAPQSLTDAVAGIGAALERLESTPAAPLLAKASVHMGRDQHSTDKRLHVHIQARPLEAKEAAGIATVVGTGPDHPVVVALQRVVDVNRKLGRMNDEYFFMASIVALLAFGRRYQNADGIQLLVVPLAVGLFTWLYFSRKKKTEMALEQTEQVREMSAVLEHAQQRIEGLERDTRYRFDAVESQLSVLRQYAPTDFDSFTRDDVRILDKLIENLVALEKLLNERVGGREGSAPVGLHLSAA